MHLKTPNQPHDGSPTLKKEKNPAFKRNYLKKYF